MRFSSHCDQQSSRPSSFFPHTNLFRNVIIVVHRLARNALTGSKLLVRTGVAVKAEITDWSADEVPLLRRVFLLLISANWFTWDFNNIPPSRLSCTVLTAILTSVFCFLLLRLLSAILAVSPSMLYPHLRSFVSYIHHHIITSQTIK